MSDLLTALALVLVIEGVAYALFPGAVRRMMAAVIDLPPAVLRGGGLIAATLGVLAVWMVRSATSMP